MQQGWGQKPGSASLPFLGIAPVLLDTSGACAHALVPPRNSVVRLCLSVGTWGTRSPCAASNLPYPPHTPTTPSQHTHQPPSQYTTHTHRHRDRRPGRRLVSAQKPLAQRPSVHLWEPHEDGGDVLQLSRCVAQFGCVLALGRRNGGCLCLCYLCGCVCVLSMRT